MSIKVKINSTEIKYIDITINKSIDQLAHSFSLSTTSNFDWATAQVQFLYEDKIVLTGVIDQTQKSDLHSVTSITGRSLSADIIDSIKSSSLSNISLEDFISQEFKHFNQEVHYNAEKIIIGNAQYQCQSPFSIINTQLKNANLLIIENGDGSIQITPPSKKENHKYQLKTGINLLKLTTTQNFSQLFATYQVFGAPDLSQKIKPVGNTKDRGTRNTRILQIQTDKEFSQSACETRAKTENRQRKQAITTKTAEIKGWEIGKDLIELNRIYQVNDSPYQLHSYTLKSNSSGHKATLNFNHPEE